MAKPQAVLISDIHFSVPTLELASQALLQAQFKAKMLSVPLIICGDTMDGKALLRAECVNQLMRLLAVSDAPKTYVLVGNHDLINEKGEDHALQFLHGFNTVTVVDKPKQACLADMTVLLIPYQSNPENIRRLLLRNLEDDDIPHTLIMHQGVQTAQMGHYIQDKTSLPPEVFADYRVISGHYHRRQDIKCGRPRKGAIGLFSYIGNPYTLNYGEAEDPEKGYQILFDNGLLKFEPTGLRKHVIVEAALHDNRIFSESSAPINKDDLVRVKFTGFKSELEKISKSKIADLIVGHPNFKLELIPIPDEQLTVVKQDLKQTPIQIFDNLIDLLEDTGDYKTYLKVLSKDILCD